MKKERLEAISNFFNGENFLRDKKKEQEAYNRDLRLMAKKPSDLISSFDCKIKNVFGEIEPVCERKHFSVSDTLIGPGTFSQKEYSPPITGHIQNLKLEVFAWDNKIHVKRIIFPAILPLEKGDFIRAYVIKGEYKSEKVGASLFDNEEGDKYLVERDYLEEERAFQLDKLVDSQVVACYIDKSV